MNDDMIPRAEADALKAVAYEAAAQYLATRSKEYPDNVAWCVEDDAQEISALTPDDTRAALEAILAEAEKRGEEWGMIRAHEALVVVPAASKEQEHAIQMCQAAIRAEAEK
jgi:molybdopterin-guanine dinucleotide biosynthesis protein A